MPPPGSSERSDHGWRATVRSLCSGQLLPVLCGLAIAIIVIAVLWHVPALRQGLAHASWVVDLALTLAAVAAAAVATVLSWRRRSPVDHDQQSRPARSRLRQALPVVALSAAVLITISIPVLDACTAIWPGYTPAIDRMSLWPASFHINGLLLPRSDAFNYLDGAEHYLATGRLDTWSSRRPINSLLLAVRLVVSGNDLRIAHLLQAWLGGLALIVLLLAVAPDLGATSAALLYALLFGICSCFIPSTLSEMLGFTFGVLAAAALWSAARSRSLPLALAGTFLTTVALTTRIGAVFVLPMLVIWVLLFFRCRGTWGRSKAAAMAMLVILSGVGGNSMLRGFYGSGFGVGQGNLSEALYGYSTGYPNYRQAYEDFPDIWDDPEAAYAHVYAAAWKNIRENPDNMVRALVRALRPTVRELTIFYFERFKVSSRLGLNLLLHGVVILGALRFLWLTRRSPATALLLANAVGFLLTAPIAVPDGNPRVLITSYPLLFLIPAAAFLGLRPRAGITGRLDSPRQAAAGPGVAASLIALVLVAGSLVGPPLARLAAPEECRQHAGAGAPEPDTATVRIGPRSIHLQVLSPSDTAGVTFAPQIRYADLLGYLRSGSAPASLSRVVEGLRDRPFCIVLTRQEGQTNSSLRTVIGPPELLGDHTRRLRLRGTRDSDAELSLFIVREYEVLADEGVTEATAE